MKYFIFLSILFNFCTVQAGFIEGMIVGSALTQKGPAAAKDEFSMQSTNMESALWKARHPLTGEFFRLMTPDSGEKYLAFFKNQGYNVTLTNRELIFDFKNEYHNYVASEQFRYAKSVEEHKAREIWWENAKNILKPWAIGFGIIFFISWCLYLFNAQDKHLAPMQRMTRDMCLAMIKQFRKK